jgi:gliding motility-associated-like protein
MRIFFIIICLIIFTNCNAQKYAHKWYTQASTTSTKYINFLTSPASNFTFTTTTGLVLNNTYCDYYTGNLRFMASGAGISDSNGQGLPNALVTNIYTGNFSYSKHQTMFLPNLYDSTLVYFIYDSMQTWGPSPGGSILSNQLSTKKIGVLSTTLNGGLGDYIPNSTKRFLLSTSNHKAATRVCKDYWLITHGLNNDTFYACYINNLGVQAPIKSLIPNSVRTTGFDEYITGQMKFSPNGLYLTNAYFGSLFTNTPDSGKLMVLSFNKNTGQLSHFFTDSSIKWCIGTSFSPDNSKLYIATPNQVYQYNMSLSNASAIKASKTLIHTAVSINSPPALYRYFTYMSNAPDGKLYILHSGGDTLSVINNPNALGPLCNFQFQSPLFLGEPGSGFNLPPNTVENFLVPSNDSAVLYYYNCKGLDSISLKHPTMMDTCTFAWNFGDAASGVNNTSTLRNATHIFTNAGSYIVRLIATSACGPDTIYKTIVVDSVPALSINPPSLASCVQLNTFTATASGALAYQWWPASANLSCSTCASPTIQANASSTYTVVGTSFNGCTDTATLPILIAPFSAAILNVADSICVSNNYQATAAILGTGLQWQWLMGDGAVYNNINPLVHTFAPGTYTVQLQVADTIGCADTISKTVFVDYYNKAGFTLSDSMLCIGNALLISDTLLNNANYYYTLGDGSVINNKHNFFYSYDAAGTYTITQNVTNILCPATSATKNIQMQNPPNANLGADIKICNDASKVYTLQPQGFADSYLWQDGITTTKTFTTNKLGTYFVTLTNQACSAADTIQLLNDCYLIAPNAFSPNGDGQNDYWLPLDALSSGVQQYQLNIFNRWGELIFATSNINSRGWDGYYGGKPQPMETYIYQINVTYTNGQVEKKVGNFILVR